MKLAEKQLFDFLNLQPSPAPPSPGVYHFSNEDGKGSNRIHLRIDSDGSGFILVNASRIYYLNPTAAYMTYLFLKKVDAPSASQAIAKIYRVPKKQAGLDYQALVQEMECLTATDFEIRTQPGSTCDCEEKPNPRIPFLRHGALQTEVILPFSPRLSAPYRMDLALTYRCNNACSHCYNARSRNFPEMSTARWKEVLDRLWQMGIPHIIFTGGEPTLRDDLPELIAYAEEKGQITGINTNGRRLKDESFVRSLEKAGLDHVQITIESHIPGIHDAMVSAPGAWQDTVAGIKNILSTRMHLMTNTTLLQDNFTQLEETLHFLAKLGIKTIGLNALIYSGHGIQVGTGLAESVLPEILTSAKNTTRSLGIKLIWYTPTQYCHFDPVFFDPSSDTGLNVKGCTAALYSMCIEPDGSVIPCQSYYHSLGNILNDPWKKIWEHELAINLRERKNVPLTCETCGLLSICGGGCPLAAQAGKISPPISIPFNEA